MYSDFFSFVDTNHGIWGQASIQIFCDSSLSLKIKEHEAKSIFFALLALCLKINDKLMCPTASANLNAK